MNEQPKQRWFQFRLLNLLVAMPVFALAAMWLTSPPPPFASDVRAFSHPLIAGALFGGALGIVFGRPVRGVILGVVAVCAIWLAVLFGIVLGLVEVDPTPPHLQ